MFKDCTQKIINVGISRRLIACHSCKFGSFVLHKYNAWSHVAQRRRVAVITANRRPCRAVPSPRRDTSRVQTWRPTPTEDSLRASPSVPGGWSELQTCRAARVCCFFFTVGLVDCTLRANKEIKFICPYYILLQASHQRIDLTIFHVVANSFHVHEYIEVCILV